MAEEVAFENVSPALKEYENILARKLKMPLYKFFSGMYDASRDRAKGILAEYNQCDKNMVNMNKLPPGLETLDLRTFQESLRDVQKWTSDTVAEKEREIMAAAPGFKLQNVLRVLFVGRSMVLASMAKKKKPLQVKVPSTSTYIHRVVFLVTRELFDNPWLMRDCRGRFISTDRHLAAQTEVFRVITEAIKMAVADLLPVDNILETYMGEAVNATEYRPAGPSAGPSTSGSATDSVADAKREPAAISAEDEFGFAANSDDEYSETDGSDGEEVDDDDDIEEGEVVEEEEDVDENYRQRPPPMQQPRRPLDQKYHREIPRGDVKEVLLRK